MSKAGKNILLVLDVNGMLLERKRKKLPNLPCVKVRSTYVYNRPGMMDFVKWCTEMFVIGVWSTAKRENVEELVKHIFGTANQQDVAFILDGSSCTPTGLKHPENRYKDLVTKDLETVWSLPNMSAFARNRTLLIDDSPYKAAFNPLGTAIHPPPWSVATANDTGLLPGGDLRRFSPFFSPRPHASFLLWARRFLEGLSKEGENVSVPDFVLKNDPFSSVRALKTGPLPHHPQDLVATLQDSFSARSAATLRRAARGEPLTRCRAGQVAPAPNKSDDSSELLELLQNLDLSVSSNETQGGLSQGGNQTMSKTTTRHRGKAMAGSAEDNAGTDTVVGQHRSRDADLVVTMLRLLHRRQLRGGAGRAGSLARGH
eukprot:757896-Hanusia_phi.AAC.2